MTMPLDRPYRPPGRPPRLSRAEADRLIYLYTTGMTTIELAARYGIHRWTVYEYINGRHKHPALRYAP